MTTDTPTRLALLDARTISGVVVLTLPRACSAADRIELERHAKNAIGSRVPLVIDATHAVYVDSRTHGVLVSIASYARSVGAAAPAFVGPGDPDAALSLRLIGTAGVFAPFASASDAVTAFAGSGGEGT